MTHRIDAYQVEVSSKTTWIWLRLTDHTGLEGVGEATLNNRAAQVIAALPLALEAASNTRLGLAAKLAAVRASVPGVVGRATSSAIEQAWLDLEGKRAGRPVHALLGGRYRTDVPCYANINRGTLSRQPDEFAARAAMAINDGYAAVKLAPFDDVAPEGIAEDARHQLIEAGFARIASVVERLSGQGRVQVDCHSRFRPDEAAVIMKRLAELGISWFEEPIRENADVLPKLAILRARAAEFGMVLAGAEQAAGLDEFEPYCHARCYDVIMPDIILAGGPSEVIRIGYLAAAVGQAVSLHNPSGPVMDMHSAHVATALPQLHSLERQFRESDLYDGLVTRSDRFAGGNYHLSESPGLGLKVDWKSPCLIHSYSGEVRL